VLRGERADVTDFFLMTLMDTSVVKHNMLKTDRENYLKIIAIIIREFIMFQIKNIRRGCSCNPASNFL